jgi:HEPN domain-containing protein
MAKYNRHDSQDSRRYFDWLDHSSADLLAAAKLKEDDRCYDLAAFHCQQSIEKALKAYILLRSGKLVDGHNLTWLCRQAKKYHKGFHQWFEESADLNQCYIETRYPADVDKEIDYKMVQDFYTMAKDMYQFIFHQVDQELDRREQAEERISRGK